MYEWQKIKLLIYIFDSFLSDNLGNCRLCTNIFIFGISGEGFTVGVYNSRHICAHTQMADMYLDQANIQ